MGSLHLPSSAQLQTSTTRPIKRQGCLRCTALLQATVHPRTAGILQDMRGRGDWPELPDTRAGDAGASGATKQHPTCFIRLASWTPQMLSGQLYLRDDGVQAVGPPGVVHWVRVQDAPGGRGRVRGRRVGGAGHPSPTHQGPRPRLGTAAGEMMPFTSCWMILWGRQCHGVLQSTSQDRLALQPSLATNALTRPSRPSPGGALSDPTTQCWGNGMCSPANGRKPLDAIIAQGFWQAEAVGHARPRAWSLD